MRIRKRNYSIFFILFIFCILASAKAQTVHNLNSASDIAYAWNLLDWKNNPIDSLRFDIYYPPGATSDKIYPMILSLHAGSFTGGSKLGQRPNADEMTAFGFAVVTIDYRTGYNDNTTDSCADDTLGLNNATYRASQDGNACMRFLDHYADSFHLDTNNFFLMGNSAGADLALHMHYIDDAVAKDKLPYVYNSLGGTQSSGNNFPFKYKLRGICAMWGGLPNWNLITSASAIPMVLFKGGLDPGLPPDPAPNFGKGFYKNCANYADLIAGIGIYNVMQKINVPCEYHFQPRGFHAAYDEDFCVNATNSFFKAIMQNQPYSGYYQYYQQSW